MLNKDVVFLRNERGWKRWIQTVGGATYRDYNKSETRPPLIITAEAPTDYPCWAYQVTQDHRYEEDRPEYLYRSDHVQMLAKIDARPPAYRIGVRC
jgi:hypothetical protein